jgi:uncharacterized Zn-binding protein involved in type VI secretion
MPGVARGNGTEPVATTHGAGRGCGSATTQATDACSGDVKVNGIGVVREGDAMKSHPAPGCSPHAPGLGSFSATVKVNGKGLGRQGDTYPGGHTISSGSSNVSAG